MRSTAAKETVDNKPPLLAVATKLLKGDEELRRIFGSSVIAEEAREARQGAPRSCCSMSGSAKQSSLWHVLQRRDLMCVAAQRRGPAAGQAAQADAQARSAGDPTPALAAAAAGPLHGSDRCKRTELLMTLFALAGTAMLQPICKCTNLVRCCRGDSHRPAAVCIHLFLGLCSGAGCI